ncbi:MAG: heme exporter protein CcmD [Hyphomicrobiales bacterium]|nr:heme exporter protein CcmD [Hyphomicrobiales bacterium]MDE2016870.1 heme exporter protein CcmD [Hyphomicrobiales bacterium]
MNWPAHSGFILAAWAIASATLAGMTAATWLDGARLKRALARLEEGTDGRVD